MRHILLLFIFGLCTFAYPAFAQDGARAEGAVQVDAVIDVDMGETRVEGNAKTEATADLEDRSHAEAEREGSSPSGNAKEVDKSTPKLMEADVATDTGAEDDVGTVNIKGNVVSASAVEVRGWDPEKKQEFLTTVKSHAEVRSQQDLENFAKGVLLADENVEEVSSDENSVEVRYRVPAKFLGIFSSSVSADVVVLQTFDDETDTDRVKVQFPWFRFLYSVPDEVSKTELEGKLSTELEAELSTNGDVDVSKRARIFQKISATLKARHDLAMNSIRNMK